MITAGEVSALRLILKKSWSSENTDAGIAYTPRRIPKIDAQFRGAYPIGFK